MSRRSCLRITPVLTLLLAVPAAADDTASTADVDAVREEVSQLRSSVKEMNTDLRRELGQIRERLALMIANTFLAAPPASSDTVGVARVAVFAPRIEADSARHRDTLNLRIRRVEAGGLRVVAPDIEISSGQPHAWLPVDQNGALYIAEWWTSEGYTYAVHLRDGASEQPVATVQVRPLQNRGRFMYVAYKLD